MDTVKDTNTEAVAELAELPGRPMPLEYGTGVLDELKLRDYQGARTKLVLDLHGQEMLAILIGEDTERERWLMAPGHSDKMRRTLRGNSPPASLIGNANFVLVQDVYRQRPGEQGSARVRTNITATPVLTQEEMKVFDGLPNTQEMMEVSERVIREWKKKVEDSYKKLGW